MACFRSAILFFVLAGARALQFPSGLVDVAGQQKDDVVDAQDSVDQEVFTKTHPIPETVERFDDLKTDVSELERYIDEQEQTTLDDINAQQVAYQEQLLAQRRNNSAMVAAIQAGERMVDNLQENISKLRDEAEKLLEHNKELSASLKTIERDVGMAQELVGQALNFSGQQLTMAEEMEVLSELAAEDQKAEHLVELSKFSGVRSLLLLSVGGEDGDDESLQSAEGMIEQLGASLSQAADQRTESLLKMKESFERLQAEGESRYQELANKMAAVNATIADAAHTQQQLQNAVVYLRQTKNALRDRVQALRNFGDKVLGGSADPVDDALQPESTLTKVVRALNERTNALTQRALQIFGRGNATGDKESLLQVALGQPFEDLQLPGSEAIYKHVKSEAVELQNAIEIQENMSLEEIQRRKAAFAQRLAAQHKSIEADELINAGNQGKLKLIRKAIGELRSEAGDLMSENAALASQLEVMHKNISTALEFVNASVQYALQRTQADPNLEVLDELRQQEQQYAHSHEVREFGRLASLSMLITSNVSESVAKTPEEFVDILRSNLQAAVQERNTSLAKLDRVFEKLYSQGEKKHALVLRIQAKQNQSIAEDSVTRERLEQAVGHLRQTKQGLSEKIDALRLFGRHRLGVDGRQSAASSAQTATEPTPESAVSAAKPATELTRGSELTEVKEGFVVDETHA